jgi:thiamine biosynthesis lipoprotein
MKPPSTFRKYSSAGIDGAGWFGQPELVEYSAWVIDRHSDGAWGVGKAVS